MTGDTTELDTEHDSTARQVKVRFRLSFCEIQLRLILTVQNYKYVNIGCLIFLNEFKYI